MAQLQLVNGAHYYLADADHTTKCSKCKSANVEITPAVAWHASGDNPTRLQEAYKRCRECGTVSRLTDKENLETAKYILNAQGQAAELLGHDSIIAADMIVQEAEDKGKIGHAEARSLRQTALAKTVFGCTFNSAVTLLDAGVIEEGEIRCCDICGALTTEAKENLCSGCREFAERRLTNP